MKRWSIDMKLYMSTWTDGYMKGFLSFQHNKPDYSEGDRIPLAEIEIDDSLLPTKEQIDAAIISATVESREKRLALLKAEQERLQKEIEEMAL